MNPLHVFVIFYAISYVDSISTKANNEQSDSLFKKNKSIIYPANKFVKLSTTNRQIVEEATSDSKFFNFCLMKYFHQTQKWIFYILKIQQILVYWKPLFTTADCKSTAILFNEILKKRFVVESKLMKKYKKSSNGTIHFLQGKIRLKKQKKDLQIFN